MLLLGAAIILWKRRKPQMIAMDRDEEVDIPKESADVLPQLDPELGGRLGLDHAQQPRVFLDETDISGRLGREYHDTTRAN